MKNQKDDRRSVRTRKLLEHALYEIMQEKRYDEITVQDILDRANVGRSTFYAHYQDKEDLMLSSMDNVLEMFIHHIDGHESGYSVIQTEDFFQHVRENDHLYKAMVWGRGMDMLFNKGQEQLSLSIEEHLSTQIKPGDAPAVPIKVTATFLSGAFLMLLKWWVDHKYPYTARQMSEMFQRLAMFGTIQAMQPGEG